MVKYSLSNDIRTKTLFTVIAMCYRFCCYLKGLMISIIILTQTLNRVHLNFILLI